ncbi:MAG: hypothetical protein LQ347_001679, partial [Umbilicaria vellea]
ACGYVVAFRVVFDASIISHGDEAVKEGVAVVRTVGGKKPEAQDAVSKPKLSYTAFKGQRQWTL